MAVSTKIIKGRIRSIGNTKKITKAMEMVSAAKMRRSVNSVLATRTYSESAFALAKKLTESENGNHPLLSTNEDNKKTTIVLITSNRGLCGSFNEKVINQALKVAEKETEMGGEVGWVTIGSKGTKRIARLGLNILAEFEKEDLVSGVEDILPMAQFVREGFVDDKFGKVILAYTDYKTVLIQNVRLKQILPITLEEDSELGFSGLKKEEGSDSESKTDFNFEPNKKEVLNYILPRIIEVELYQALLESNASEYSARMMAMKSASEAASDMISDLTLIFNRARQAYITQEIAEISGGKAALESK